LFRMSTWLLYVKSRWSMCRRDAVRCSNLKMSIASFMRSRCRTGYSGKLGKRMRYVLQVREKRGHSLLSCEMTDIPTSAIANPLLSLCYPCCSNGSYSTYMASVADTPHDWLSHILFLSVSLCLSLFGTDPTPQHLRTTTHSCSTTNTFIHCTR
jgi:hypothetical protein